VRAETGQKDKTAVKLVADERIRGSFGQKRIFSGSLFASQTSGRPFHRELLHKNEEGDEVVHFLKRDQLALNDPRYVTPRHPRRRVARGIASKSIQFNGVDE
jgi:hypothetical protein